MQSNPHILVESGYKQSTGHSPDCTTLYVHANPHRDSESNSQTRYIHDLTARSAIASPIHGVAVWIYPAPSTTTCSTWLLNSSVGSN